MTLSSLRPVGAALLLSPLLLSGCGGGGTTSNSSSAYIRSVDAAVNPGVADILINGAANYGDQTYFGTAGNGGPASPYQYIGSQTNASLSYLLPNQTLPTGASPVINYANISNNDYYTAVLIGSFSANFTSTPTDPRVLQTILLAPRGAPNGSAAEVRVVDAAPDAGFTQSSASGGTVYSNATATVTFGSPTTTTFNTISYGTATGYQSVPPGSVPVTVTFSSGPSPVTTTVSLSANTVYTLFIAETSTGTYEVHLLTE